MHTPAHTADAFKFLARTRYFAPANLARLLDAVRAKLESHDAVFTWGENDRLAWALHAAVRRPDAEVPVFEAWTARWVQDHTALWAGRPGRSDPLRPGRERQAESCASRSSSAMEQTPSPSGEKARLIAVTALARMR